MNAAQRVVRPERLDVLSPDDPRARRSRDDLQRVHRAMGSVAIMCRAIDCLNLAVPPRRVLELGAGDGTLLLRMARTMFSSWSDVDATLLDQHDLVTPTTRSAFAQLGWRIRVLRTDVLDWARRDSIEHYNLCVSTLFLHHFHAADLALLLAAAAARVDALVACEPRRNVFAALGSRLVGLLGSNAVTRHDAVTSVVAGFAAQELTALWPHTPNAWHLQEYWALPFTHCFTAVRTAGSSLR